VASPSRQWLARPLAQEGSSLRSRGLRRSGYVHVTEGLPGNAAVEAEDEPAGTPLGRDAVAAMLAMVDYPELLLEKALTRSRLTAADWGYVHAPGMSAASGLLVTRQGEIPIAEDWGGGHVASSDGTRFTVPCDPYTPGQIGNISRPVARHPRSTGRTYSASRLAPDREGPRPRTPADDDQRRPYDRTGRCVRALAPHHVFLVRTQREILE
jgi:Tn3 transposase DDE domain